MLNRDDTILRNEDDSAAGDQNNTTGVEDDTTEARDDTVEGEESATMMGDENDAIVYETGWETSESTPAYATIAAVADAMAVDPVTLPPLFESIDPDALNALFSWDPGPRTGQVTFAYCGYEVVITGSTIQLRQRT